LHFVQTKKNPLWAGGLQQFSASVFSRHNLTLSEKSIKRSQMSVNANQFKTNAFPILNTSYGRKKTAMSGQFLKVEKSPLKRAGSRRRGNNSDLCLVTFH
jgi:hypothetical protein